MMLSKVLEYRPAFESAVRDGANAVIRTFDDYFFWRKRFVGLNGREEFMAAAQAGSEADQQVLLAYAIAKYQLGELKRKNGEPAMNHALDVANRMMAKASKYSKQVCAITGLLHDVPEDTVKKNHPTKVA